MPSLQTLQASAANMRTQVTPVALEAALGRSVTPGDWHRANCTVIERTGKHAGCGFCDDCASFLSNCRCGELEATQAMDTQPEIELPAGLFGHPKVGQA